MRRVFKQHLKNVSFLTLPVMQQQWGRTTVTVNMSISTKLETKLGASGPYPENKDPYPHW